MIHSDNDNDDDYVDVSDFICVFSLLLLLTCIVLPM